MRRILIARARRKQTQRRGARADHLDVDELEIASPAPADRLLALNDALDRFAGLEPQQAVLVKLRYFVGFKTEEAAEVLGVAEMLSYLGVKMSEATNSFDEFAHSRRYREPLLIRIRHRRSSPALNV